MYPNCDFWYENIPSGNPPRRLAKSVKKLNHPPEASPENSGCVATRHFRDIARSQERKIAKSQDRKNAKWRATQKSDQGFQKVYLHTKNPKFDIFFMILYK
jgi:hypothetical protein